MGILLPKKMQYLEVGENLNSENGEKHFENGSIWLQIRTG